MKIYTRTGDNGETGLFGGGRVPKNHTRVDAYGEVDELNAFVGHLIAGLVDVADDYASRLIEVQGDLFVIGAHLATPSESAGKASSHLPPLPSNRIDEMESWIDEMDDLLPPLKSFILPGGTESAARCHIARAVCRRAERRVTALMIDTPIEASILIYLNRLSDLLFTLGRSINHRSGVEDVPWEGRSTAD